MFQFDHVITDTERRTPIRKILSVRLTEISQIALKRLIQDGKVLVNETPISTTYRGIVGDQITISLDESLETAMLPEALPLTVIFEDDQILVVDKPAGLLVHPSNTQKTGTLLNAVCYHLRTTGQTTIRPGLVHRLDRNTSGLIVLAKTSSAHRTLAKHFTNHWIEKKYLGLAVGHLSADAGTIDAPIGSDKVTFPHWRVMEDGRSALTDYRVIRRLVGTSAMKTPRFTLLELTPHTGRTNQLRIHLAHLGFPMVNDYVYGKEANEEIFGAWPESSTTARHFLHATELRFRHPLSGESIALKSELPADIQEFMSKLAIFDDHIVI